LPEKGGRKKNPGINPGQPVGKGQKKKTLVLTLDSPPKKGGRKKNTHINPGQPARKRPKKKKKTSQTNRQTNAIDIIDLTIEKLKANFFSNFLLYCWQHARNLG
jgi:hypothetical protein